jgi:alpha/beta superfamily hydrolase
MIALPAGPEEGLVLEGLHLCAGEAEGGDRPGAVIAPPHPLYGGSMESPVVTELADACERSAIESLRFNWRGMGASAGQVNGDIDSGIADYAAALDWIEESVGGPITACGYSFGAAVAVRAAAARPRVRRLLLVSPPPSMLERALVADFHGSLLVTVGDRDDFAPVAELEKVVADLPGAVLEVIPEADHFLMNALGEVGRAARSFLGGVG